MPARAGRHGRGPSPLHRPDPGGQRRRRPRRYGARRHGLRRGGPEGRHPGLPDESHGLPPDPSVRPVVAADRQRPPLPGGSGRSRQRRRRLRARHRRVPGGLGGVPGPPESGPRALPPGRIGRRPRSLPVPAPGRAFPPLGRGDADPDRPLPPGERSYLGGAGRVRACAQRFPGHGGLRHGALPDGPGLPAGPRRPAAGPGVLQGGGSGAPRIRGRLIGRGDAPDDGPAGRSGRRDLPGGLHGRGPEPGPGPRFAASGVRRGGLHGCRPFGPGPGFGTSGARPRGRSGTQCPSRGPCRPRGAGDGRLGGAGYQGCRRRQARRLD